MAARHKAWPDLEDRLAYHLMDEAEKAFRARQRSLTLPMPKLVEDG
jgi:hypothetical protein